MSKKFKALICAVAVLLASTAGAEERPGQMKIGVLATLTGPLSWLGEEVRTGFDLALAEMEDRERIELVWEDGANDPKTAVTAYTKLRNSGTHVLLVFGSALAVPVAPLANRDRAILLAGATNAAKYSTPHDYTFRVNGPAKLEGEFIAGHLATQDSRGGVAVLTGQSEYPVSIRTALLPELAEKKIEPVLNEDVPPGERDFLPLILRLKQRGADKIVLLMFHTEAALFLKQAKEQAFQPALVLGINSIRNDAFFHAAGDAAQGVLITNRRSDPEHPAAKRLLASGRTPSGAIADGYDSLILITAAMRKCGENTDCIRDELFRIKDYHGLGGTKSFDAVYGDMIDYYELLRADLQNRKFVPLH